MDRSGADKLPGNDRPNEPRLFVLSGPSGVGKDTILSLLKKTSLRFHHVTTLTTRAKRASEKDGSDYHFVSEEYFRDLLKSDELLESAQVYGNWYGVPKASVRKALKRGEDVIIKTDIQGAATIKKLVPQAITIFISPSSLDDLAGRLGRRRTETAEEFNLRLQTAEEEMKEQSRFDFTVLNKFNEADQTVKEILGIINSERGRSGFPEIRL